MLADNEPMKFYERIYFSHPALSNKDIIKVTRERL